MQYPAIGFVELNSIARGIEVCDAMVKVAEVDLIEAHPICAGKYMVLVTGNVDAVRTSVRRGEEVGDLHIVDTFVIPNVHPQVAPALRASTAVDRLDALGVVETFSAASAINAADAAVKAAEVQLLEIRLANGMGGKSFFTFTGIVGAVQSASMAALELIKDQGMLVHSVVIPAPHEMMGRVIL
ncbi:MAG: BMC domain-containing protein [Candidatus Eremiobacteraeota bacterium]|nr:BMC domain-containing protein [Candidatus Eremiobacteraeota bacterium]